MDNELEKVTSEISMPLFQELVRTIWEEKYDPNKINTLIEAHKGRSYYNNLLKVIYVLLEIKKKLERAKL